MCSARIIHSSTVTASSCINNHYYTYNHHIAFVSYMYVLYTYVPSRLLFLITIITMTNTKMLIKAKNRSADSVHTTGYRKNVESDNNWSIY